MTTGEGGIVTTDNDAVAEQLRMLRSHGMANRDQHVTLGYNFRMCELNGAIGTAQVDRLERFNKRRRDISDRLLNELNDLDWLEPATVRTYVNHAYFWAPFEVKPEKIGMSGKEVWRKLRDRGVETRHRYNIPLYDQPVFER
ncbi:DegT/DnrJ/EryC1/StrS family aminotransferase, partial [Halobellus sp. Atlit-38R]|uniref:DegT/DnrJ/EryC1/StrS family aminotransferase n=1 Tax=Halobellus sp. Atlit-38R TaxID=2282131 RepID=UPI00374305AF